MYIFIYDYIYVHICNTSMYMGHHTQNAHNILATMIATAVI